MSGRRRTSRSASILDRILARVNAALDAVQADSDKLDQILAILEEPAPIAAAEITLQGASMAKKAMKATVDFKELDNGSATGTISFVDSVGEPTSLAANATCATTATSSDPGLTVVVDSTGLILTITPTVPLASPLPVGVVVSTSTTITNADGSVLGPFAASSQPIDVIAGGPAGASISLA